MASWWLDQLRDLRPAAAFVVAGCDWSAKRPGRVVWIRLGSSATTSKILFTVLMCIPTLMSGEAAGRFSGMQRGVFQQGSAVKIVAGENGREGAQRLMHHSGKGSVFQWKCCMQTVVDAQPVDEIDVNGWWNFDSEHRSTGMYSAGFEPMMSVRNQPEAAYSMQSRTVRLFHCHGRPLWSRLRGGSDVQKNKRESETEVKGGVNAPQQEGDDKAVGMQEIGVVRTHSAANVADESRQVVSAEVMDADKPNVEADKIMSGGTNTNIANMSKKTEVTQHVDAPHQEAPAADTVGTAAGMLEVEVVKGDAETMTDETHEQGATQIVDALQQRDPATGEVVNTESEEPAKRTDDSHQTGSIEKETVMAQDTESETVRKNGGKGKWEVSTSANTEDTATQEVEGADSNGPKIRKYRHPTNKPKRDMVRSKIAEVLKPYEQPGDDYTALNAAIAVEHSMYRFFGKEETSTAYNAKCRSILFNLRDPKNPDLRRRVLSGAIQPERLTLMDAVEMASDELKKLRTTYASVALRSVTTVNPEDDYAVTDMFFCRKCQKRKCTYYQMQTRSADEPMTTFVTCLSCGNRWKA